jgi:hypothetical protein
MRIHSKTIETITLPVRVIARDISDGLCGLPGKCMEKIAIERAARELDPKGGDHKVRIDAGRVKMKLRGYQWEGATPKIAKVSLIQFDKEERQRNRARKIGEDFESRVKPHQYKLVMVKGAKINPMTPERQKQINEARRKRVAEGKPDKTSYNLHKRVVGLANV